MRRRLGPTVILLAAMQAPVVGDALTASSSAGGTVTLSTGAATARPGDLVHVTVRIQGALNVGSVPFTLHYDPSILELVPGSALEGGFLKRDRAATTFLVSPGPASRPGTVLVGLSRLGGGPASRGARGKGTLCRLTFRARAPGVSPLTFSKAQVMDPSARQLEAVFRGGSLLVKRRT